jgi:hypothetical protein
MSLKYFLIMYDAFICQIEMYVPLYGSYLNV